MDNIEKNFSSFTGAYPCCLETGNFLVHGADETCLLCARSKVLHLHSLLSDVVSHILDDNNALPPSKDTGEEESFSLARSLSNLADTKPSQLPVCSSGLKAHGEACKVSPDGRDWSQ